MERKDIVSRDDLLVLLHAFYAKALHDDVIGHFFTQVVQLDLDKHIPVIADFWETILLGGNSYTKNAMLPHIHLNRLSPMQEKHFDRWLKLFYDTIDFHFQGKTAEKAKQKAMTVATIMRLRTSHSSTLNVLKHDPPGSATTSGPVD